VLVVGTGIGGLTTAPSPHAAGVECTVVDKARALTAAGVGINMQPHAVRELTELHLGEGPPIGGGIRMWRGTLRREDGAVPVPVSP
jgi:2-polyprenyl-6-methoxyphenol hydroxylase-like FAD-dependent oxidoreductase